MLAYIIPNVERRGELWATFATNQLGKSKETSIERMSSREMTAYSLPTSSTSPARFSARVPGPIGIWPSSWHGIVYFLPDLTKRNAPPTLQHEFCALWNEIFLKVEQSRATRLIALPAYSPRHSPAIHQFTSRSRRRLGHGSPSAVLVYTRIFSPRSQAIAP
jgi:hypothetical protein